MESVGICLGFQCVSRGVHIRLAHPEWLEFELRCKQGIRLELH